MTQADNMVSDFLVISKKLHEKEFLSDDELCSFVGQVYTLVIDKYLKKFQIHKSNDMTLCQYGDIADLIINVACTFVTSAICGYANDRECRLYELPQKEVVRLIEQLVRIMQHDNILLNELFSQSFVMTFHNSIKNAQNHKNVAIGERTRMIKSY